jgi:phage/plasmid-like protein (TIGR03299 family)
VGNDDLIEKYLFLTTSHDGFGSITVAFTPIRIVCNNTLNAALRNMTNCLKIRHTESAKERLEEAHKVMVLSNNFSNQLGDVFNRWSKIRIRDKEVLKLVQQAMAPSKEVLQKVLNEEARDEFSSRFNNTVESICNYAFANPTQQMDTTRGTLFGAYNAITGYFQNVLDYKNDEQKLKSVMSGNGYAKSQNAFNICLDFEKYGNGDFIFN